MLMTPPKIPPAQLLALTSPPRSGKESCTLVVATSTTNFLSRLRVIPIHGWVVEKKDVSRHRKNLISPPSHACTNLHLYDSRGQGSTHQATMPRKMPFVWLNLANL